MQARTIKTQKVVAGTINIFKLLDKYLPPLSGGDIVAITSKIISLCENRIVPIGSIDKEKLVIQESDYYLPGNLSNYGYQFTIANNNLVILAGIDESNGNGQYILSPKDAQKSANKIRKWLKNRFNLKSIGVVITDSTCQPLRRGTMGICLAHSGFAGLRDYVGTPDIFGRPLQVTQAGIASGLAAAAVLAMGEGTEQTPMCIISDVPFVKFQSRNPTAKELAEINIPLEEDLFAPFLKAVPWKQGKKNE